MKRLLAIFILYTGAMCADGFSDAIQKIDDIDTFTQVLQASLEAGSAPGAMLEAIILRHGEGKQSPADLSLQVQMAQEIVSLHPEILSAVIPKRDISPLQLAAGTCHYDMVEALLDAGADPNKIGPNALLAESPAPGSYEHLEGQSPLHIAVGNAALDIAQLLIARGARVDAYNLYRETPLLIATKKKLTPLAKLLLMHNANPNTETKIKETPLHFAVTRNHVHMAALLLAHGATIPAEGIVAESTRYDCESRKFKKTAIDKKIQNMLNYWRYLDIPTKPIPTLEVLAHQKRQPERIAVLRNILLHNDLPTTEAMVRTLPHVERHPMLGMIGLVQLPTDTVKPVVTIRPSMSTIARQRGIVGTIPVRWHRRSSSTGAGGSL